MHFCWKGSFRESWGSRLSKLTEFLTIVSLQVWRLSLPINVLLLYKKPGEVECLLEFSNPQDQLGSDFCMSMLLAAEGKIFFGVTKKIPGSLTMS